MYAHTDTHASVLVRQVGTSYLGPVKHAGLVHVVPRVEVESTALVLVQGEQRGPPFADLSAGEI